MTDTLDRLKTALADRYARDLRYALRVLRRNPVFTTVAVVTLALGVGPNTAIYSVLHGVVLKPLPYPEYDRLVSIGHWASAVNTASGPLGMTPGLFVHYRGLNRTVEGIAMFRGLAFRLTEDGEPEDLGVVETTVELSAILRVSPLVGRWFNQEDVTSERDVVVLSHELWVQRYGADSAIVGRTIRLNDKAYEVVGIMPQDFSFPWKTPLWTLYKIQGTAPFRAAQPFGAFRFGAVARLKLGVSLAEVEADLEALIPSVHDAFPGAFARFVVEEARLRPDVVPLRNSDVQDVQHTLWLLMGTAGFVLLIACANAGNLFLVRAHVRQREVAVRAALGAGRGDLVRSFLMESTLLALLGGMLGLAAAFGGVRALVSVAPSNIPRVSEIGIDGSVLLFTGAISLLTGILFGVIPILRPPPSIVSALKEHGGGSTTGPSRSRARHVLVVGQMSLVLVLLTGAGLMIRSFWHLNRVDPGFDPTNVLTFRATLSRQSRTQAAAFQHELLARLAGLPGVQSVGAVRCLPLVRYCHVTNTLWVDGSRADPADVAPEVVVNTASAGYFETLRIPLLSGRTFGRADTEQSTSVVVVSAAVAATFWPGDDPIGKRVHLGVESEEPSWLTVVGIVGNVQPHQLTEDAESQRTIYTPLRSPQGRSPRLMTFVVRTSVEPLSMTGAVKRTVWSLDPRLPVTGVRTMDQVVSETTMPMAFITALLIIAASVALVLGSLGIYGVIAYTVGQRTGEIGLRMALGASAQDVSRMVVGQGLRLVLVGISIGLAGAFALTRLMRALLFEVSPTDPVTFTSVSVLLLAVALLATYFPARRATLVDPADALRSQ